MEAKSVGGGSLLLLKARKPLYKEWMDKHGVNEFLKKAQKTTRFRDIIIEKFAAVYGLLMVEEEEKNSLADQITTKNQHIEHQQKKLALLQDTLAIEEDAKRRMLLRYIHAVKEHAMTANDGSGGVLQLPESNIGDEEVHALAALLRSNVSIEEVNMRGNNISDDGARALAAVLAGKTALKSIDLKGNKVSKAGIKTLAEALERNENIKHVYVHAGGKIEALGSGRWAGKSSAIDGGDAKTTLAKTSAVETVCIIDVRDNNPDQLNYPYQLEELATNQGDVPMFKPINVLESKNVPKLESSPKQSKKSKKALQMPTSKSSPLLPGPSNSEEKKKSKLKLHEDQLLSLRESAWQGRSGGLDIEQRPDNTVYASVDFKSKKINQRTPLPPLVDEINPNNRPENSPVRGHSAPDLKLGRLQDSFGLDPELPEALMASITKQAEKKKRKEKKKKTSEVEKRIMESPLGQPLFPRAMSEKKID